MTRARANNQEGYVPEEWGRDEYRDVFSRITVLTEAQLVELVVRCGIRFPRFRTEEVPRDELIDILFSDTDKARLLVELAVVEVG